MTTDDRANLDRSACQDPRRALATEWLETDGVGGFASSTVWNCPTRRYHGVLTAWPEGLAARHLFVAGLDPAILDAEGGRTALATPASFALDPYPVWTWRIGDGPLELRQELLMPKGRAATLSRFTLRGGRATLELRPALACREADALHFRNDVLDPEITPVDGGFSVRPYAALPAVAVTVAARASTFDAEPQWLLGIELSEERARGYDAIEDHWRPGVFRIALEDGEAALIAASIDEPLPAPDQLFERAAARRRDARQAERDAHPDSPGRARLADRAEDFFQVAPSAGAGPDGRLGICAGFPWFVEWGRDTFISLPGLTLARGRVDRATRVLGDALGFLRDGLLPNIYGTSPDDSHYGSVDAALWFARAVDLWREAGGDRGRFDREFAPALLEIASSYHEGLGHAGSGLGIRARDDDLLVAGRPDLNATWMDARTPDGPVTPRDGMPVEIEALWISLLDQCAEIDGEANVWATRRDRAFRSFTELFWLEDRAHLADRVAPDGTAVPRLRPNMVLAAALGRSPLTVAMRKGVLDAADRDLLTAKGLRTLAASDPEYRGRYRGGPIERDHAYHQGTVWPWLIGSYVELALRVRGAADLPRLRALLDGFDQELDRAGLDHLSEVFDGDPPHRPGGTIAQAWSTAELLRAHRLLDEAS